MRGEQLGLMDGAPILTLFICAIIGFGVGDAFMSVVEVRAGGFGFRG